MFLINWARLRYGTCSSRKWDFRQTVHRCCNLQELTRSILRGHPRGIVDVEGSSTSPKRSGFDPHEILRMLGEDFEYRIKPPSPTIANPSY